MHFVYIIYSNALGHYYVGESANVDQRLLWHNEHEFKHASTKRANDWQIQKVLKLQNRSEARIVERYIKSMKSSRFISKIINEESFYENFKRIVFEKFQIVVKNCMAS